MVGAFYFTLIIFKLNKWITWVEPNNIKISGAKSIINTIDAGIQLNEDSAIISADLLETKEVELNIDVEFKNNALNNLVEKIEYTNKIIIAHRNGEGGKAIYTDEGIELLVELD